MKLITLIFALSMISMPSLAANQWLCTAEKMTTIFENDKGDVEAYASDTDQKFVVSENGLKFVGSDEYHFSAGEYTPDTNGGINCDSRIRAKGFMNMTVSDFVKYANFYHYQIAVNATFVAYHTQIMGRCEKL